VADRSLAPGREGACTLLRPAVTLLGGPAAGCAATPRPAGVRDGTGRRLGGMLDRQLQWPGLAPRGRAASSWRPARDSGRHPWPRSTCPAAAHTWPGRSSRLRGRRAGPSPPARAVLPTAAPDPGGQAQATSLSTGASEPHDWTPRPPSPLPPLPAEPQLGCGGSFSGCARQLASRRLRVLVVGDVWPLQTRPRLCSLGHASVLSSPVRPCPVLSCPVLRPSHSAACAAVIVTAAAVVQPSHEPPSPPGAPRAAPPRPGVSARAPPGVSQTAPPGAVPASRASGSGAPQTARRVPPEPAPEPPRHMRPLSQTQWCRASAQACGPLGATSEARGCWGLTRKSGNTKRGAPPLTRPPPRGVGQTPAPRPAAASRERAGRGSRPLAGWAVLSPGGWTRRLRQDPVSTQLEPAPSVAGGGESRAAGRPGLPCLQEGVRGGRLRREAHRAGGSRGRTQGLRGPVSMARRGASLAAKAPRWHRRLSEASRPLVCTRTPQPILAQQGAAPATGGPELGRTTGSQHGRVVVGGRLVSTQQLPAPHPADPQPAQDAGCGRAAQNPAVRVCLPDSFSRRVLWTLHEAVKFGETVSYQQLAALAGNPKAARAVGGAMRRNPVSVPPDSFATAGRAEPPWRESASRAAALRLLRLRQPALPSRQPARELSAGVRSGGRTASLRPLSRPGQPLWLGDPRLCIETVREAPDGVGLGIAQLPQPNGRGLGRPARAEQPAGGSLRLIQVTGAALWRRDPRRPGAAAGPPVPILIPCHRVTCSSGAVGHYSGGLGVKEWLLAHEGSLAGSPRPAGTCRREGAAAAVRLRGPPGAVSMSLERFPADRSPAPTPGPRLPCPDPASRRVCVQEAVVAVISEPGTALPPAPACCPPPVRRPSGGAGLAAESSLEKLQRTQLSGPCPPPAAPLMGSPPGMRGAGLGRRLPTWPRDVLDPGHKRQPEACVARKAAPCQVPQDSGSAFLRSPIWLPSRGRATAPGRSTLGRRAAMTQASQAERLDICPALALSGGPDPVVQQTAPGPAGSRVEGGGLREATARQAPTVAAHPPTRAPPAPCRAGPGRGDEPWPRGAGQPRQFGLYRRRCVTPTNAGPSQGAGPTCSAVSQSQGRATREAAAGLPCVLPF
ncbi:Methylated-DNA--protein-cysteine methyltransferase, partial [Galemys pyrenaicus]